VDDWIHTWSPILVPLLGLLAGTGWLQYYLNHRRSRREQYRALLEDFLLPFEGTLKTTQAIFNKLRDDRQLSNLEYHPSRLQHFFASLQDDDPRKHLWKSYIEWLQTENRRAVDLVQRFYGRIVLPTFKKACDDFLVHAKEWEMMWKALTGSDRIPTSLDTCGRLVAPLFPSALDGALRDEIAEVRRRSGSSES
jgi:hypothetical protein